MKKLMVLAAILAFSGNVMAAEGGYKTGEAPPPPHQKDQGYKGSEDTAESSVESVRTQRDNAWVTMEGYLIKKTGKDSYDFRDNTGTIKVIVPHAAFDGKEYTAKDKMRLSGYVKGKGEARHIQAQQIRKP
ncbi:NirD/YgiW/YdeI family stress tolerance protein [Erwinia sp. E_sp_B04_7]|uniref:YgiW/YdeI family stress tolerance OB fold protein n=1 Tax=unclassified Erwinia TaxID=2622719 RepID=UPI0030D09711